MYTHILNNYLSFNYNRSYDNHRILKGKIRHQILVLCHRKLKRKKGESVSSLSRHLFHVIYLFCTIL